MSTDYMAKALEIVAASGLHQAIRAKLDRTDVDPIVLKSIEIFGAEMYSKGAADTLAMVAARQKPTPAPKPKRPKS